MTATWDVAAFVVAATVPPQLPTATPSASEQQPEPAAVGRPRQDAQRLIAAAITSVTPEPQRSAPTADNGVSARAVGFEVAARVHAVLDGGTRGNWDASTIAVCLGSAAGSARALNLDVEAAASALSIAATQACGIGGLAGTGLGNFQLAEAARAGAEAAQLSAIGMSAPATGLEGRRGLFAVIAPEASLEDLTDGLGVRWKIQPADAAPEADDGPSGEAQPRRGQA